MARLAKDQGMTTPLTVRILFAPIAIDCTRVGRLERPKILSDSKEEK